MIQLKINNMDHKAVLTVPADYERVVLALWTIGLDRDPEKYTLRQLDAEFTYTTEEESQMVRLIDPRSSLTWSTRYSARGSLMLPQAVESNTILNSSRRIMYC